MSKIWIFGHKYRVIIISLILVFILSIGLVVFLSKHDFNSNDDVAIILSEGDLVVNYINGNEILIKDKKEHTYNISIINNSDKVLFYSINLDDINATKSITAKMYDESDNVVVNLDDAVNDSKLMSLVYINPGTTVRYKLVLKNKVRSEFKAKINVVNESESTQTFGDLLLLNNVLKKPVTVPGTEVSLKDEGLISGTDTDGVTYYFRGSVNDNYVKIGEMLFRIVRINGDGTIRLVLDTNIIPRYPYNTNLYSADVGYNGLSDFTKASIMNILNDWYTNNVILYDDFLANGTFCVDNSFNNVVGGLKYSNSYNRIYNSNEPSFVCNGSIVNSKIGLLTADEVLFAGAVINESNEKFYLYNDQNTGDMFTLSTYYIDDENKLLMINLLENGMLGNGILASSDGNIRPVVNVSATAKVKGKGTINNPYVIVG